MPSRNLRTKEWIEEQDLTSIATGVADSWGELKTKVEGGTRGDFIVANQGTTELTADSQIQVPSDVGVDLRHREIVPDTDTQDIWDIQEGAKVHTGIVLPSSSYTGTVFLFDGDDAAINGWERTVVSGKINPRADGGTFTGHHFKQTSGGNVAGVVSYVVQRGGVYADFESGDSTGFLNGNIFRGQWYAGTDGILVSDATGSVGQNKLDGCVLEASTETNNALDLGGTYWHGDPTLWDLGNATTGITFQGTAGHCYIMSAHSSVIPANMSVASGATNNRVYATDHFDGTIIWCDSGSAQTQFAGILGEEAAGAGNAPTAGNFPTGLLVENTDDDTVWINTRGGMIQVG